VSQIVELPGRFAELLQSLGGTKPLPGTRVKEIPAPSRVAPYAVALDGRVPGPDADLASGSLIFLHDPDPPPVWQGDIRVVSLVKAQLETDMGDDPLLSEVIWTYLVEALDNQGPWPRALAGTVTRTLGEAFADLRPRSVTVGVEVRASWSPVSADVSTDFKAWMAFLARLGGLEPVPDDVVHLVQPLDRVLAPAGR
jgi:hypothetical protein